MRDERRLLAATAAGAALLAAGGLHRAAPLLLWNVTTSAPVGLYLVTPGRAARVGDYVAVRPQRRLAAWMDARGYLPRGVPLLKRLAAGARQEVCRYGARLLIDGREVARARFSDRQGRALPEWAGCRRLGPRDVLLLGAPADSLDGRYFGPGRTSDVIGTAWRLPPF